MANTVVDGGAWVVTAEYYKLLVNSKSVPFKTHKKHRPKISFSHIQF